MLLGGAIFSVDAQTPSVSKDPAGGVSARGSALFEPIEEKIEELRMLKEDIEAASGGDREILESRAREKILELSEDVRKAANGVLKQEYEGIDSAGDRQRVAELLKGLSPLIRSYIEKLEAELVKLRDQLDEAGSGDDAKTQERIFAISLRLDKALDFYLEHKETSELFGLETEADRKFLETKIWARAELLAGRIAISQEQIVAFERRLQADAENGQIKGEVLEAKARLDRYTKSLAHMITLMDSLDLETAQYKQQLFEATGEITTSLLSREVLSGLVSSWIKKSVDWLFTNGGKILFKIVIFLSILLGFKVLSKVARRVVKKGISASNLDVSNLLERTAVSVTGTLVMMFGFLVALSQFGFEVAPLLAGLGVMGFIVGFALQDTLGNFAAGVMILLYRPYDVGDLIETAGACGKVSDMSLVATTILTLDHQTLVVPNSKIWGDVIKNVTAQDERRVDMVFGISYSDDIKHAERVMTEIVDSHPKVLTEPEPMIKLHNLGESSVDFVVRPWAKTEDYWDVYWDITREIKIRFDAEKISIPFPQRDVHVVEEKAS